VGIQKRKKLVGGHLTAENYIQKDRDVFTHLLKLGIEDALARGQVIDLDTSEELPRLIPILCALFSREELTQLVGEKMATKMLNLYRDEVLQNLFLERELQSLLRAFNEAKIPLILFKGPALAYSIYPKPDLRTYNDIDVMIHPADLPRAHALLTQKSYRFYEEFRSNAVYSKRTGYNYTLESSGKLFAVLVELHTAPHTSEIGTVFDIKSLWAKAQPISVMGEYVLTMDPMDHLLYLCWHYRFHGFTRLLWLYDLVVMLRAIGAKMDWVALVQMARHQGLETTLYYCLSWCRDLFGVVIPEEVFAWSRPPLASRFIIERIALSDGAQALSTASSQPRRFIAHRVMVDSSTELLKAGVRALFPSPASMGRRYMNRSRLPLGFFFVFYLIHPWITLAKGCRYLLAHRHTRRIAR
jgi:hypothetical protein